MLIRRIQRRLARVNIRLLTSYPTRLLKNLPKRKQRRINRNTHIRRDKILLIKSLRRARKHPKSIEDYDDAEEDEGEPGGVWLEGGFEDEGVAGDALSAEGGVEADVGDGDGHPG